MAQAVPRLLHLLRLSWLLAIANLALGRPAAAARLIAVAEHTYGARQSVWRRASIALATLPRGGSAASLGSPSALPGALGLGSGGAYGADDGGFGGRPMAGINGGRAGAGGKDPALSMCRYLRGLALLAQGDKGAAAEQLEVKPN